MTTGFSSSHVQMWELGHKECWVPKIWYFQLLLEKVLESPLDYKEIKLVSPKGNQPWIFIQRTDEGAETQILWPPDAKSWLSGKDSDAGKIEGKRRRGWQRMRWVKHHHWLNGHKFEQTQGDNEGQGSLACHSPWGNRELDTTWQLNKTTNQKLQLWHKWLLLC